MRRRNYTYLLLGLLLFVGCDATKKVPEQSYLLNKVEIRSDVRGMGESELSPYLRPTPQRLHSHLRQMEVAHVQPP